MIHNTLIIEVPNAAHPELVYIFKVLFEDFSVTGYNLVIRDHLEANINLKYGQRTIEIPFSFFPKYYQDIIDKNVTDYQTWINISSDQSCYKEFRPPHLKNERFVGFISEPGVQSSQTNVLTFSFDILGAIFFVLSRMEEWYGNHVLDQHQRFSSNCSSLKALNLLSRPIVDEWVDILFFCLEKFLGLSISRSNKFEIIPTHDQDMPYKFAISPLTSLFRTLGVTVIKDKKVKEAAYGCLDWMRANILNSPREPVHDAFNTTLKISELDARENLQARFFYLAGGKSPFDPRYSLSHPLLQNQYRKLSEFNHLIGIHPSYHSMDSRDQFKGELENLKESINQFLDSEAIMSRQHYLRFQYPKLIELYQDLGIKESYNMGFADAPGFRAGTSCAFFPYDFNNQRAAHFKEYPLMLMECSVIDKQYMGLGYTSQSLETMVHLKERCQLMNRPFCFLWHNSRLRLDIEWEFYKALISA